MNVNNQKTVKRIEGAGLPEKEPRRTALEQLQTWENEFRRGTAAISKPDEVEQTSKRLVSMVRKMSGTNHTLCERKMIELSNKIEDATIDGPYSDNVLEDLVRRLRDAAELEKDPTNPAPWSDHMQDLGWKSRQYTLADHLWKKNPKGLASWKVDLADIKSSVWGDEDAKTMSVRSCASRLKSFLKDRAIDIEISVSDPNDSPGWVKTSLLAP